MDHIRVPRLTRSFVRPNTILVIQRLGQLFASSVRRDAAEEAWALTQSDDITRTTRGLAHALEFGMTKEFVEEVASLIAGPCRPRLRP